MSKNERGLRYPFLEKLTTEDLEDIIRADLEGPDLDFTLVSEASHILSMRRCNGDGEAETAAAWERFQKYYNTSDGQDQSLYDISAEPAEMEHEFDTPVKTRKPKIQKWRHVAAAAAAVLVLVLTVVPPAVGAASIFTVVGQWTDEIFSFGAKQSVDETTPDDTQGTFTYSNAGLEQFAAAVKGAGINVEVVPKWLPEGYKLEGIESYINSDNKGLLVGFSKDDQYLSILVESPPTCSFYEKDEAAVETYIVNGVTHYIFENIDNLTAAWCIGEVECSICGQISIEEMKNILDSIYLGGSCV